MNGPGDGRITSKLRMLCRNLFETGDYQIMIISKEHKEKFHSVTAKLIFIKERARPNIETTVGFFSTRVTKNTKRDW